MQPYPLLEQQYGIEALWGWVKDWIEGENECEDDEHVGLIEYLWLRAENADEMAFDKPDKSP